MKFAHIFAIAAAAALFTVPAQAGSGFTFEAQGHIEAGGAVAQGGAAGGVAAAGHKVDIENTSEYHAWAGEYKGKDCDDCGSSSVHQFYSGADANNTIHADSHGGTVGAVSATGVGGGAAIGSIGGAVSASGSSY